MSKTFRNIGCSNSNSKIQIPKMDVLFCFSTANEPYHKLCMPAYLFPFPVSQQSHNATSYDSAISKCSQCTACTIPPSSLLFSDLIVVGWVKALAFLTSRYQSNHVRSVILWKWKGLMHLDVCFIHFRCYFIRMYQDDVHVSGQCWFPKQHDADVSLDQSTGASGVSSC